MSKLRDRIRDISRRRPQAFGFAAMRATEPTSSRQVLVVARVDGAQQAAAAVADGADAILHTGALSHLAEVVAAAGSAVVGANVDAATAADVAAIREAGAHFLVCTDDQTEAAALLDQQIGYILVAPTTATPALSDTDHDARLRSFRALDLDGVLVGGLPQTMTVRQQLQARRLGELARKPLFVALASAVSAATLELWRDAGVVAVVADAAVTAELATAADAVPAPRRANTGDRAEAIVPAAPSGSALDDDEDDD
ncbi:MAG: hypothetical protein WC211_05405 [Dehalococcoidia bacterium]